MRRLITQFLLAIISSAFLSVPLLAAPIISPSDLPGSVEPGVIGKTLQRQTPTSTLPVRSLSPVASPEQPVTPLGPKAEQIKFKLTRITLEGNTVYSDQEISTLYKNKINTLISVGDLLRVVQDITNYYRNNGYILSRAILPPQRVDKGIVHVKILEGFIDEVKIVGQPKRAQAVIQSYLNKIRYSKPLQVRTLEYYLLLVNNIPGVHVKAVLEPSKTTLAASTLNVVAETTTFSGYASYDNYGTLYIGPNEGTISGAMNSIFRSGDSTRVTFIETSRPKELQYGDLNYSSPIGSSGLRLTADLNQSNTRPGLNLRPLKIEGKSNNYTGTLDYPLILTRQTNVSVNGAFNYNDAGVNTFGQTLYEDHVRSVQVGVDVYNADKFKGTNVLSGDIEQGLNILGASHDPTSLTISRADATSVFTKLNLQATRTQQLGSRFSAFILAKGQYSNAPLLASEQFAFGGSQVGRGYDSADIIGDLGTGGTAELRMDVMPGWRFLQYLQPYVFYDGGIIWNRKNVSNIKTKQSETSAGFGVRFLITNHVSGNLMLAQPLTKQDATELVVGNGRRPRGFFSITVSG